MILILYLFVLTAANQDLEYKIHIGEEREILKNLLKYANRITVTSQNRSQPCLPYLGYFHYDSIQFGLLTE